MAVLLLFFLKKSVSNELYFIMCHCYLFTFNVLLGYHIGRCIKVHCYFLRTDVIMTSNVQFPKFNLDQLTQLETYQIRSKLSIPIIETDHSLQCPPQNTSL